MRGKTDWRGSKVHRNTEIWTESTASQWNSSGIFSQDSIRCSLSVKSKSSCQKWAISQKNLQDGSSSCRCSTTSHGDFKDNETECIANASIRKKNFQQDVARSLDLGQRQSDILLTTKDHKENGTESLNWWWSNSEKDDTHIFWATSPLSRGTLKSKGGGKLSIHFCADGDTIEIVFSTIISVNQLSIYGAVLRCVWRM